MCVHQVQVKIIFRTSVYPVLCSKLVKRTWREEDTVGEDTTI